MQSRSLSRRELFSSAGAIAASVAATQLAANESSGSTAANAAGIDLAAAARQIKYCLNMSTVRGQKLSLPEQVDLAAKAGYDAIEPWMGELEAYVQNGGSVVDLRKRISDAGLTVESAIGFAQWIVDDDQQRKAGLEQAKRDMDLIRSIGGKRLAAPPTGATSQTDMNLYKAAERYRALLELGDSMDVSPEIEVWGFSTTLSKLGETMLVAVEAKHPRACVLPDVYHLYKGGSEFAGLGLVAGSAIQVFHMNDYPADMPRAAIKDADRVYPGDGIAPLRDILRTLLANGFHGVLSLELFNPEYWKQDARLVADTGLAKLKESVAKAVA